MNFYFHFQFMQMKESSTFMIWKRLPDNVFCYVSILLVLTIIYFVDLLSFVEYGEQNNVKISIFTCELNVKQNCENEIFPLSWMQTFLHPWKLLILRSEINCSKILTEDNNTHNKILAHFFAVYTPLDRDGNLALTSLKANLRPSRRFIVAWPLASTFYMSDCVCGGT